MVPSGRWRNQVGCSVTQGWSGLHWKAMSSARSMLWARVVAMRASKSAKVPSAGRMAVWPPSALPIARCGGAVVAPFAEGVADGVDGRHVEDVEAHRCDLGDAGGYVAEGAVLAVGAGGAGEELIPAGEAGALAVDPEWELVGVFGGQG
jgi:hypothetical protein